MQRRLRNRIDNRLLVYSKFEKPWSIGIETKIITNEICNCYERLIAKNKESIY